MSEDSDIPDVDRDEPTIRGRVRRLFAESTTAGRTVGWTIMVLIGLSCVSVAIETLPELPVGVHPWLRGFELVAVGVFTIEYVLRIASAKRPLKKAAEPLVVIDLIAILPFYVGLLGAGVIDLRILRLLRTLRVLRLLKLNRYSSALRMLATVVSEARHKLISFTLVATICIVLMGSVMYHLEPETFRSIPHAIWWSVVTLTTVGYGETVPQSAGARAVTGLLMLLGIGIVAIPTGIVSSGMVDYYHREADSRECGVCGLLGHLEDAQYCRGCGSALEEGDGVS